MKLGSHDIAKKREEFHIAKAVEPGQCSARPRPAPGPHTIKNAEKNLYDDMCMICRVALHRKDFYFEALRLHFTQEAL